MQHVVGFPFAHSFIHSLVLPHANADSVFGNQAHNKLVDWQNGFCSEF
jgi:hypothetical protein